MARARNIKPKFFENEDLAELDPLARLLFIGMWTIADFKGCLEYRPKRIKVQLLPYDDCNITELTNSLDKSGFIAIYSVLGQKYIKIINFEKHQNPHKNERQSGSELPDIDKKDSEINELKIIEINLDKNGTNQADSLNLIPDSFNLIPDTPNPEKQKPEPAPRKKRDDVSFDAKKWLIEKGATEQHATDWLRVRKEKKGTNTPTAFEFIESEAVLAGMSIDQVAEMCARKPWCGFEAKWVLDSAQRHGHGPPQAKPEKFNPTAYVNRNRIDWGKK